MLPDVPSAMNWPVCPVAERDCEPGLMAMAVKGSEAPPVTVKVAVAVTTVPPELLTMAVMVVVPWLRPVARPVELIFAICVLLELQTAWAVTSSVAPDEVVPMAMNWLV